MTARAVYNYKDALRWLIENDDTSWVVNDEPSSPTADLIEYLFATDMGQIRNDLKELLEE